MNKKVQLRLCKKRVLGFIGFNAFGIDFLLKKVVRWCVNNDRR